MSLTEQAFVKAFARRNRNSDASPRQTATSKPSADELTLDERVADSATLWVDPTENKVARADLPGSAVPKPHIEPAPAVARPQPARVVPADSVAVQPAAQSPPPPPAQPPAQAVAQPAPESSANAAVDSIAELVSSLQQIHTAYGSVDTSDELMWVESTNMPATKVRETQQTPATESATHESQSSVATDAPSSEPALHASEVPPADTRVALEQASEPETQAKWSPFQAAWEVDVFDIPKTVADLFFDESLFQDLSDRMGDAVAGGLRTMLVTSVQRGEGRSSVAIGIALAAAASGVRVALVDADIDEPTLADDLRLDLEFGWLDTVRCGLPIREVAVHAVEDSLTLIPLVDVARAQTATAEEIGLLVEDLRDRFDLVVIDGPAGDSSRLRPFTTAIDSAIIVRDGKRTHSAAVESFASRLTRSGVQGVGMVENFI